MAAVIALVQEPRWTRSSPVIALSEPALRTPAEPMARTPRLEIMAAIIPGAFPAATISDSARRIASDFSGSGFV